MKKNIPFFSLDRQYKKNEKIFSNAIKNVLETQSFVGGKYVQEFEKNFSTYTKSKHAISCNSGTDAIWIALKALNLQKDSIVLTTPFSFIASSSEIVAHGAHPVFIDIDRKTFNIDPKKITEWIESETELKQNVLIHKKTGYPVVGILFVDIFGQCADHKQIKSISDKYNLWTVEDACQAVGAQTTDSQVAGTLADISCFSFYPTKNLGAFGDGGCSTTNNEYLAEKMIQIRNHGRKSHYNYVQHGINSRLDGIQAAILNTKLRLLDEFNESRNNIAKIYNEKLKNISFINLPKAIDGKHVYHQYCIQVKDKNLRDQFAKDLANVGVSTNVYYPKGLNELEFLNTNEKLKNDCPISQNLTETILALPIWPELENNEVEYMCEKIIEVCDGYKLTYQKETPCEKRDI